MMELPPPAATPRPLEESRFFAGKASPGRFFTLSGQVRARFSLGVADGNAMGNATDVLVIGGGLAGLPATLAARKKGFSVTVADDAKPPIDPFINFEEALGEFPRLRSSLRNGAAGCSDHFAPLRKRVLCGLASDPICFERMLTAHVRETSPAFLVEVTVGWGWRLVATKAL
jgi:FAD binding domain